MLRHLSTVLFCSVWNSYRFHHGFVFLSSAFCLLLCNSTRYKNANRFSNGILHNIVLDYCSRVFSGGQETNHVLACNSCCDVHLTSHCTVFHKFTSSGLLIIKCRIYTCQPCWEGRTVKMLVKHLDRFCYLWLQKA